MFQPFEVYCRCRSSPPFADEKSEGLCEGDSDIEVFWNAFEQEVQAASLLENNATGHEALLAEQIEVFGEEPVVPAASRARADRAPIRERDSPVVVDADAAAETPTKRGRRESTYNLDNLPRGICTACSLVRAEVATFPRCPPCLFPSEGFRGFRVFRVFRVLRVFRV